MYRPIDRHGAERLHQSLQVQAVQQFHHEEEGAVLRHAEVVKADRMRRFQRGGCLRLSPEAFENEPGTRSAGATEYLLPDELDGGGPRERMMRGAIDLPHSPLPQHFLEPVAPQLASLVDLLSQTAYDLGRHYRNCCRDIVRKESPQVVE